MKKIILLSFVSLMPVALMAQTYTPDTVVVELGTASQVVFTMQDPADLEQLKQYDFEALFDDIILQLESRDSSIFSPIPEPDSQEPAETDLARQTDDTSYHTDTYHHHTDTHHKHFPYSRQFFNMDFGMNNYFENGNNPDDDDELYRVHPWGSWYIGLNAVNRTRFSPKFYLESGLGISWYNFKFEEEQTLITQTSNGVTFTLDPRELDFTKSKLTASYLNLSLIPMFDVGGHYRDNDCSHWHDSGFRIGAGPYVGYRLDSYTKQQYEESGDKEVNKDHDHFYMEDFRYGLRFQIGLGAADFFFNYDLNSLFEDGKGPGLNAYSFGITF